jgi:hypothetical protein
MGSHNWMELGTSKASGEIAKGFFLDQKAEERTWATFLHFTVDKLMNPNESKCVDKRCSFLTVSPSAACWQSPKLPHLIEGPYRELRAVPFFLSWCHPVRWLLLLLPASPHLFRSLPQPPPGLFQGRVSGVGRCGSQPAPLCRAGFSSAGHPLLDVSRDLTVITKRSQARADSILLP